VFGTDSSDAFELISSSTFHIKHKQPNSILSIKYNNFVGGSTVLEVNTTNLLIFNYNNIGTSTPSRS